MRNRVRRTDKFIFLFSLFYVFLFLGVNTLTNGLDFLFTIPFNFLGVYVSYLLVLIKFSIIIIVLLLLFPDCVRNREAVLLCIPQALPNAYPDVIPIFLRDETSFFCSLLIVIGLFRT